MTARGWITTAVLALAVAVGGSAWVSAQGGPDGLGRFGRGPMGPGMMKPGMMGPGMMGRGMMGLRGIELTDAQREQIKSIMQSHRADMQALGEQVRTADKALQDAIEQVPVNESLIRQRAADAATVQADAALLRARVHAQVFQVLTPDQQAKGKELRQKAEQRMQHGWQQRQQRQKPGAAPRQ